MRRLYTKSKYWQIALWALLAGALFCCPGPSVQAAQLSATVQWYVPSGGSNSNGGGFDTGVTMDTTGAVSSANTSSPVFSSTNYSFVSGDVGAWVYIKSGTNTMPGFYKIASVAGGDATLSAAVGAASVNNGLNITAGCGTTSSLTSVTWSVDYGIQNSAQFNLTSVTTTGTNAIVNDTSSGVNLLGNGVNVASGTNALTGFYTIISQSTGATFTLSATCCSGGALSGGVLYIGGGFATVAQALAELQGSNTIWFQNATESISTALTTSVAGASAQAPCCLFGYNTIPGDLMADVTSNRPIIKATAPIATGMFQITGSYWIINGVVFNANSETTTTCLEFSVNPSDSVIQNCLFENYTGYGINGQRMFQVAACEFTSPGNTVSGAVTFNSYGGNAIGCYIHDQAGPGITYSSIAGTVSRCILANLTGSTADGIQFQVQPVCIMNCDFFNIGRDGARETASGTPAPIIQNNIFDTCGVTTTGYGINFNAASTNPFYSFDGNAYYNNTSGNRHNCGTGYSDILLTGSPFTNVTIAGGVLTNTNFALNSTAGAGTACKAAGIPSGYGSAATTNYWDVGAPQSQGSGGSTYVGRGRTMN